MHNKIKTILLVVIALVFLTLPATVSADDGLGNSDSSTSLLDQNKGNNTSSDGDNNPINDNTDKSPIEQAKDKEANYQQKTVLQGGIALHNGWYKLDNYQGYADTGISHPINGGLMGFYNSVMVGNRFLYQAFDSGINLLASTNLIDQNLPKLNDFNHTVWTLLANNFLAIILVIVAIAMMFLWMSGDMARGFSLLIRLIGVFVVAGVLLTPVGTNLVRGVNNISQQMEGTIANAGLVFAGESAHVDASDGQQGATATLRNTYFDNAIYRPWLMMNFGTTNEATITKNDSNRISKILGADDPEKAADDDKSTFMDDSGKASQQKFIALVSTVIVIGMGIPLLILALFNLILQIAVLALFVVLPISFFLSLLPWFSESGYKNLATLIGLIIAKAFVSMFVVFTLLIQSIVNGIVAPTDPGYYLLNALLFTFLLWLMITKWRSIVSVVTAGRVAVNGGNFRPVDQAKRNATNNALDKVGLGNGMARQARPNDGMQKPAVNLRSAMQSGVGKFQQAVNRKSDKMQNGAGGKVASDLRKGTAPTINTRAGVQNTIADQVNIMSNGTSSARSDANGQATSQARPDQVTVQGGSQASQRSDNGGSVQGGTKDQPNTQPSAQAQEMAHKRAQATEAVNAKFQNQPQTQASQPNQVTQAPARQDKPNQAKTQDKPKQTPQQPRQAQPKPQTAKDAPKPPQQTRPKGD